MEKREKMFTPEPADDKWALTAKAGEENSSAGESKKERAFTDTLKNFGETTSIKGIPKVLKAKRIILKVVWFLALIIGGAAACYQLVRLITRFLENDYVTRIQTCNDCRAPFPDVTVCNLQAINLIASMDLTAYDALTYDQYLRAIDDISIPILESGLIYELMEQLGRTFDEMFALHYEAYTPQGYYQNIHDNITRMLLSRHFDLSVIRSCTWYGWDNKIYPHSSCFGDSLYQFYSPEYLSCFTIHLNESLQADAQDISSMIGLLYLHDFPTTISQEYTDSIYATQARGARILIHPPNTLPDMAQGFNIPPGHEVNIRLSPSKHTLPPAQVKCSNRRFLDATERRAAKESDVSRDRVALTYSDQACIALCHQENTVRACGCFHPHYPLTDHLRRRYPDVDTCGKILANISQMIERINCFKFVTGDEREAQQHCKCPQRCKRHAYDFKVFQSPWPTEFYQNRFWRDNIRDEPDIAPYFSVYDDIDDRLRENRTHGLEMLREYDLIERNFIQLKILFQDEGKILYTGVPAVDFEAMFGSMGGILNLWVGITFFTIIEFMDLCYKLGEDLVDRIKQRKQQQSQVAPFPQNPKC